jgi:putative colanic acid biosynthesis acetyltransferase WcaF
MTPDPAAISMGPSPSGAPSPPDSGAHEPTQDLEQQFIARGASPYKKWEKIGRILWNYVGQKLFRLTFHNWYGLRNTLLRAFGARIGAHVRFRPTVLVEQPWNLRVGDHSSIGDYSVVYCLGTVTIGRFVSISQRAHLCAGSHDLTHPQLPLVRPPILVHDQVWIAADAFVGPGVTIGEGAVLGARGCAFKDLPAWGIYGGNPARKLRDRPRFKVGQGCP